MLAGRKLTVLLLEFRDAITEKCAHTESQQFFPGTIRGLNFTEVSQARCYG